LFRPENKRTALYIRITPSLDAAMTRKRKAVSKENELTLDTVVSILSPNTRDAFVKCGSDDDATALARLIFDDDTSIDSVLVFGKYVHVGYAIINSFAARARRITALAPAGVVVTSLGRQQLAALSITWTTLHERVIAQAVEPDPLDGYINIFQKGRWTRRLAEKFMLGQMVCGMASSSKDRDHAFDVAKALAMLRAAVPADGRCGCCKGPDGQCPVIMTTFGKHAASPDRRFDELGYTDEGQILTLVAKEHNVVTKHTAEMRPRARPVSWLTTTGGNTSGNFVRRMAKLARKQRKSESEAQQLVLYATKTRLQWKQAFTAVLVQLREATPNCAECGNELHYGDEKGMLHFTNNGQQASPDRIENSNPLYSITNVRMVCTSCQHVDKDYRRVSSEAERTKQGPVAFVAANWLAAIDARIAGAAK
jgi:hypothetical protein